MDKVDKLVVNELSKYKSLVLRLEDFHELLLTCAEHHRKTTKNLQRAEFFEDVLEDFQDWFPEIGHAEKEKN